MRVPVFDFERISSVAIVEIDVAGTGPDSRNLAGGLDVYVRPDESVVQWLQRSVIRRHEDRISLFDLCLLKIIPDGKVVFRDVNRIVHDYPCDGFITTRISQRTFISDIVDGFRHQL